MHELAVTQNILEICLQHANQANATKITGITLVVGQFSSIVDESVRFYWDLVADNTIAHGARLHFNRIPGEMTCQACGLTFRPTNRAFVCPSCCSLQVRITNGEQFRVESIDVE